MQITIACGSMKFGPNTPTVKSLGGSETAALMLAKELGKRGHNVTMFCNLPPQGAPDFFPNGGQDDCGVRYIDLPVFRNFAENTETDLFICVRDPGLIAGLVQAKKKVLWMHDIATKRGMQRALDQMQWTFDEIWTVSEWHKRQVSEVTGYPLKNIKALRNGCVRVENEMVYLPRSKKTILYAARPERGLDNLIRPGGIMDRLPEYTLLVAMYEHFPEHMRDYYAQIFARMKEMPNVEFIGGKPNVELRGIMREVAAYIYPTEFEETSCILAREAIETQTPFFTTKVGALPETLGSCGIYFEDYLAANGKPVDTSVRTDEGAQLFADFFRDGLKNDTLIVDTIQEMLGRKDLYWDGVAEMVEKYAEPNQVTPFSRAWSLIQDGDVIPAIEFMRGFYVENETSDGDQNFLIDQLWDQVYECYPFLFGQKSFVQHYEDIYTGKIGTPKDELQFCEDFVDGSRFLRFAEALSKLPPGARVLEVGCGAGHILGTLAKHLPQHDYTGIEFSAAAVNCVNKGAEKVGRTNLRAYVADGSKPIADQFGREAYDAVIISEVLEHVVEPWDVLQKGEACVKKGGLVLVTVPYGPWEPWTFREKGRFLERAHIWHIDREMLTEMIGDKQDIQVNGLIAGMTPEHRAYGNIFLGYKADHAPINKVSAVAKALRHRSRQTAAAAIIAYNNEDTIVRLLNSLVDQVQFVQIAHGPSTDNTKEVVDRWFSEHRWMFHRWIDVPKIEPYKFGFDHARNKSIAQLDTLVDWILWIDTDEYLSGDLRKYLRHNCLDGYVIHQHHFTTIPRGEPAQIDKPARLIRANANYKANGHIHEHFEIPEGGPGRCTLLSDVDIGHTGYVNEDTRRARFQRNYPFLCWDHEEIAAGTQPPRRLHHFLWFRDLVHVMRYAMMQNNRGLALQKAQEAVNYYDENWKDMASFGPGLFMSLGYLSEAYGLLGTGVELKAQIALDDRSAMIGGRFASYEQFSRLVEQVLKPEFEERQSRYY